ncbi:RmlC-like jelly roll fold protein [Akanthomyces lecanii RCEF 1005]|uniref:RmlC-like jelly roll fold protein n=1 Tax=Akanthomyces lecanii RCEF 1005 TaxID=1081108 RepID=A0A168GQL9_CORDF|nr:RmlC-like jelly roll fold protein [Akanthomyces lecanii RCEF 1005]
MGLSMATEATDPSMEEYVQSLPKMHMEPLWSRMSAMVPPSPNPACQPYLWRYSDCLPYLSQAGSLVTEKMAERRVLMLVNPAMKAPHTTDTLYGGLQWVNPGEVAPAHRHIAYAARFIIDGNGFTAVEGKKMPLTRGDVVVTPTWHWHDHGNESNAPVVWLDVLNLPLFTYLPVNFAESYAKDRYPSVEDASADWRHPWHKTQEALDNTTGVHTIFHYKDSRGRPLSTTIGVQAERISPFASSQPSREVSSFLYHCYGGQGHTVVIPPSGDKMVFHWRGRDTFAVPAWSSLQHFNESRTEPAYLVGFHDGPFLDNLGLRATAPPLK